MKFILDGSYAQRSWVDNYPRALVRRYTTLPILLSKDEYQIICDCDGKHDIPSSTVLSSLIDKGYVHPCPDGSSLSPWQEMRMYFNFCVPSIYLEITGRCNLNCLHCFNAMDNNRNPKEFPLEDLDKLTDDARDHGVQGIWITGGEPMLHPRFMDIIRMIHEKDMYVPVLVTNGMFLTDSKLDELYEAGFRGRIMISYDGAGHHDTMRQMKGAEKIVLESIRRVVDRKIPLLINMNLNRLNMDTFDQSLDILDSIGVSDVRVIRTVETPRWALNGGSRAFSPADFYQFSLESIERYMAGDHRMNVLYREFAEAFPANKSFFIHPVIFENGDYTPTCLSCGMVRQRIAIGADGSIYPCMQASGYFDKYDNPFGSWYDGGLEKQFTKSPYLDFARIPVGSRREDNDECSSCKYFENCIGGCRLQALLTAGSFNGPDRIRCDFFKNGYMEKLIKLGKQHGWKRVSYSTGKEMNDL